MKQHGTRHFFKYLIKSPIRSLYKNYKSVGILKATKQTLIRKIIFLVKLKIQMRWKNTDFNL